MIETAIIGAGPAGAYCAYCLAEKGIQPKIFDASHPREKPCGGFISSFAQEKLPFLNQIPIEHTVRNSIRFISPSGKQIISHIIDQLESDHGVNEGYYEEEAHPAANAIYRRIINSHPELVQKFTVREISDACNDYAEGIGDIEEIGSSDVSIWTKDVIDDLLSRNKELSEIL